WDVLHEWLPEYPAFAPTITTWAPMREGTAEEPAGEAPAVPAEPSPGAAPAEPALQPPAGLPLAELGAVELTGGSSPAALQRLQALLRFAPPPFLASTGWARAPPKPAPGEQPRGAAAAAGAAALRPAAVFGQQQLGAGAVEDGHGRSAAGQ